MRTFLNGKFTTDNGIVEINTAIPFVSITLIDGSEYYFENNEANEVIDDIYSIWSNNNEDIEESIDRFIFANL